MVVAPGRTSWYRVFPATIITPTRVPSLLSFFVCFSFSFVVAAVRLAPCAIMAAPPVPVPVPVVVSVSAVAGARAVPVAPFAHGRPRSRSLAMVAVTEPIIPISTMIVVSPVSCASVVLTAAIRFVPHGLAIWAVSTPVRMVCHDVEAAANRVGIVSVAVSRFVCW